MNPMRTPISRLRALFTTRRDDARLAEEIDAHLDFLAADFERRGLSPREARFAARREFGGATQVQEEHRDQRGLPLLASIAGDFRYGLAQIRKSPGFAAAAILTLALGIGANTVIYRALDAVAFRPLPVRDPGNLRILVENHRPTNFDYPLYRDMATRQRTLDSLFASGFVNSRLGGAQGSQPLPLAIVSGNYFSGLGARVAQGRPLLPADDRSEAGPVAVISDLFWEKQFHRGSDALGKTLRIANADVTVVGIAAPEFYGDFLGLEPDLWVPMSLQPRIMSADWLKSDEMRWLTVMARLAPGGSPRRAATALEALRRRLQPKTALDVHLALEPGARGITQGRDLVEGLVFALMALVAVVLLIACCNLANLLLGRGATRTHEIGVRLALGAGRGRVVRQLLTESLALSIIGGVAAYALAAWAWQFLIASVDMQRYLSQWDWHAPLFTAAATVLAACLFSLAPALVTTKVDLLTALQSGRRSYSAGHRSQRLGRTLVAAQVSVSLLLLYGAALLGRSFWNLQHRDLGFRPQGLLMAKLDVELDFSNTARDAAIGRPLLDRLNNLPGVVSAAIASAGPFGNSSYTSALSAPGHPSEENSHHVAFVSPRYFETMGIRIVAGRGIEETDHATAPKVAVISQSVARRLFGDANPVGRLVSETPNYDDREALRIVGVANDACFTSARDGAPLVFYIPLAQEMEPVTSVMVRTAAEPRSMIAAVRSALRETAPDRRIEAIEPAQEAVGSTVSSDFLLTTFTGGFSLLALALTSLGVYSVVAYAMSGRKREIGIRLALGATRTDVTRMVAREFAVLVGGSAVVGAAAALAMARLARGSLFGVAPNDYLSLGAAVLVLTAVAALAVGIPARRASRLDPMDALRQE